MNKKTNPRIVFARVSYNLIIRTIRGKKPLLKEENPLPAGEYIQQRCDCSGQVFWDKFLHPYCTQLGASQKYPHTHVE